VQIYVTAGNDGSRIHYTELVPARHGFALSDAILNSKARHTGGGIFLTQCMDYISGYEPTVDRVIVFTDEQDCDTGCNPETAKALGKTNYIVNVSSERYGIAYGKFNHITGFSEAILDYIRLFESL
jgi:hypothetical protein